MNPAFFLRWFCLWLLAPAMPAHAVTFNVTAYGAVGDDRTDNTAAFTACLKAVVAAGGGKMYHRPMASIAAGSSSRRIGAAP
jgi:hypothetical protein